VLIFISHYDCIVESATSESMIPRPCLQILQTTVYLLFYCMFTSRNIYFGTLLLFTTITHTTCVLLSLRRTSAPIHLTSVLGVLGTQETFCILIAGLLERNIFDLYLPEFDKPWVIHLRETCCCPTNLCSWRPNTVYRNTSVRRHQAIFWRRCRGGERLKVYPLDPAVLSFCFLFLFALVRLNGKQRL
jgi:hypothetical protein